MAEFRGLAALVQQRRLEEEERQRLEKEEEERKRAESLQNTIDNWRRAIGPPTRQEAGIIGPPTRQQAGVPEPLKLLPSIGLTNSNAISTATPTLSSSSNRSPTVSSVLPQQIMPQVETKPRQNTQPKWNVPSMQGPANTASISSNLLPVLPQVTNLVGGLASAGADVLRDWYNANPSKLYTDEKAADRQRSLESGEMATEAEAWRKAGIAMQNATRSPVVNMTGLGQGFNAAGKIIEWHNDPNQLGRRTDIANTFDQVMEVGTIPAYTPLSVMGNVAQGAKAYNKPNAGPSVAGIVAPLGAVINQEYNPFNPNYNPTILKSPGVVKAGAQAGYVAANQSIADMPNDQQQVLKGTLRMMGVHIDDNTELSAPTTDNWWGQFLNNGVWMGVQALQGVNDTLDAQDEIAKGARVDPALGIHMRNVISGPTNMLDGYNMSLNRDWNVQDLQRRSQEAQEAGRLDEAALLWAQSQDLATKSNAEILEEHMNPWAELLGGIFLDVGPLGLAGDKVGDVLKGAQRALKTRSLRAIYNIPIEQAEKQVGVALRNSRELMMKMAGTTDPNEAVRAYQGIVREYMGPALKVVDKLGDIPLLGKVTGMLDLTPIAKTELDADVVLGGFRSIFKEIQTKEDAGRTLAIFLRDPMALVRGVGGYTSPKILEVSPRGVMQWGPGVVGNNELTMRYPIIGAAAKELQAMKSLQGGVGPLNKELFGAEVAEIIFNTASKLNGARDPKAPMSALQAGAALVAAPLQLQKRIMSDMYLGLRPANWIRNALSGNIMLMADDLAGAARMTDIRNYFVHKTGAANPFESGRDVAQGARKQVSGVLEPLGDALAATNIPLVKQAGQFASSATKALYNVAYGDTRVGNLPVGEVAMKSQAHYVAHKRAVQGDWRASVRGSQLGNAIRAMDLPDDIESRFIDGLIETGVEGNKFDVMKAFDSLGNGGKPPLSLKGLGIPDDIVSSTGYREINRIFNDTPAERVGDAISGFQKVIDKERAWPMDVLHHSPKQVGDFKWFKFEWPTEAGRIADLNERMLRRAGSTPQDARKAAQMTSDQYLAAQSASFDSLREAMRKAPNHPHSWQAMTDYASEYQRIMAQTRHYEEEMTRDSLRYHDWDARDNAMRKAWDANFASISALGKKYEGIMQRIEQGVPYKSKASWGEVLERNAQFDYDEFRKYKDIAITGTDDPNYSRKIAVWRGYVDNGVAEMWEAWKRFPTMDNFNVITQTMDDLNQFHRMASTKSAEFKQAMMTGKLSKPGFYSKVSALWEQSFSVTAGQAKSTARAMVAHGVINGTSDSLRFNVGKSQYVLLTPKSKSMWEALDVNTGARREFAAPNAIDRKKTKLPQGVVDEFYRLSGEKPRQVDMIGKEVAAAAEQVAPTLQGPPPRMSGFAEDWRNSQRMPPQAVPGPTPLPLVDGPAYTVGDAAKVDIASAKEARAAMRRAWAYDATAGAGLKKLDTLVMKHSRNGVVNLNLDKGEIKTFEDFYGKTLMGKPINNIDDVRKFLQDYVDLSQQVKAGTATVKSSKQYAKMSAAQIIEATREELRGAGFTDAELAALATENRRTVLEFVESIQGVKPDDPNMVAYESTVRAFEPGEPVDNFRLLPISPEVEDFFKLGWEDGIRKWGGDIYKGAAFSQAMAGQKTITQADIAFHYLKSLDDLEQVLTDAQRLGPMLGGSYGTATAGQRQAIEQAKMLAARLYDNSLEVANASAEDAANWAMLDFRKQRNIDSLFGFLAPFSFFLTRMPARAAMAALKKPSLINLYYETTAAIDKENERANVPSRLRGTLPIPGFPEKRVQVKRFITDLIPGMGYLASDSFLRPEDINSESGAIAAGLEQSVGIGPLQRVFLDWAQDGKVDDLLTVGSMVPFWKMWQYANQGITGKVEAVSPLMGGTQFDAGITARDINAGSEDSTTEEGYMRALADADARGAERPEVPDGVLEKYIASSQQTGWNAFWKTVSGYMISPISTYTEEEQRSREIVDNRRDIRFNQGENPMGSRAGVRQYDENTFNEGKEFMSYVELYDINRDPNAVYDKAENTDLNARKEEMYNRLDAAEEAEYAANPDMTQQELSDTRGKYYDWRAAEATAIETALPRGAAYTFPEGIDRYAAENPQELNLAAMGEAQRQAEADLEAKGNPAPVYPGDGKSYEEYRRYGAEKDAYEAQVDALAQTYLDDKEWVKEKLGGRDPTTGIIGLKNTGIHVAVEPRIDASKAPAPTMGPQVRSQGDVIPLSSQGVIPDPDNPYAEQMAAAEQKYGLPAGLLQEVARGESKFDPSAYNKGSKASGLFQFVPSTWGDMEKALDVTDPQDPDDAVEAAAYYLDWIRKQLPADKRDDVAWIAGAYNVGVNAVKGMKSLDEIAQLDYEDAAARLAYVRNIASAVNQPANQTVAQSVNTGMPFDGDHALTQSFGVNPERYKSWGGHMGLDYKMPVGTELLSTGEGTVVDTGSSPAGGTPSRPGTGGFGNWIIIDHGNGYVTEYAHLSQIDVKSGDKIAAGQVIGLSGHTGVSDFPHLHFGVRKDGEYVDPTDYLERSVAPPVQMAAAPTQEPARAPGLAAPTGAATTVAAAAPATLAPGAQPTTMAEYREYQQGQYTAPNEGAIEQRIEGENVAARSQLEQTYPALIPMYDEYKAIITDAERQAYAERNPLVRAVNFAANNPEEHAYLEQTFGKGVMEKWAQIPPYEEGSYESSDYYRQYPEAFLAKSWITGRPEPHQEWEPAGPDTVFDQNFGKDFELAKQKFGANIWDTVAAYKRLDYSADKEGWIAFKNAHPEYDAWNEWWYEKMDYAAKKPFTPFAPYERRPFTPWSSYGSSGGFSYGGSNSQPPPINRVQAQQAEVPQWRDFPTPGGDWRKWMALSEVDLPNWRR